MASVSEIEGIGPGYAEKLKGAGVDTVEELLAKGGTAAGRDALAAAAGVSEKLVLKWVNHADLCRIDGIGPQMAELLEAAGVDTVVELGNRNADNLATKLDEVNAEKNRVNRVPNAPTLEKWIADAKALPRVVTH
jgi:predicted flap endonuclease-1-like 5' DNA nuclease